MIVSYLFAHVHWVFISCHPHVMHVWFSLIFTCFPFYFDLIFTVLFHSSVLMHLDLHTDLDNLDTVENNLRHSAKGSLDTYDVLSSLKGCEPNDTVSNELVNSQGSFSYVTPSSALDMDDTTLGKLLTEAHREYGDTRSLEGVSVSQSSLSVVFNRTGKLVGESNVDQFGFGVTRNTYSAHSKFFANTQAEKMVDRTGKPVGESSSSAQISTLLDEQRQMIIAEDCEKVFHHELEAAHAEEERRILREELCNKVVLRWTNYENSRVLPSMRLTIQKFIEDQKTIMELSGRLQEWENEVNCMNDSKDFQDAESVRSGNSHVASQPMLFLTHPSSWRIIEAFIRIVATQRWTAKYLGYIWYIRKRFCKSTCFLYSSLSSRIEPPPWRKIIEEPLHMSTAEKSERWKQNRDLRCQSGPSAKDSVIFSGGDFFKELWGRPTTTADFWSPLLTSSLHQQPLLAGR